MGKVESLFIRFCKCRNHGIEPRVEGKESVVVMRTLGLKMPFLDLVVMECVLVVS